VFIVMGLYAPNAQAAQGMSLIAFIFAFISSTYVPATSMPGWLQPFARNQPLSLTVTAVRHLLEGGPANPWLWQALAWPAGILLFFFTVALHLYRNSN